MPVYLTLQPIRCAASHVTMSPGGLLPHLFTIADIVGCYFLSHYSAVSDSLPLASMVLCVARTFLPSAQVGLAVGLPDERRASARRRFLFVYMFGVCLDVSFNDAAFAVADKHDDFVAFGGGRQLGFDAGDGV